MNGLPYYKAFPRDFFEGTRGMDGDLKGTYRMVLDLIYQHNGALHNDPRHIAGELGISVRMWNSRLAALVEMGKLTLLGDIISNFRAEKELLQLASMQDKQRENRSHPNKNNRMRKTTVPPKSDHTEPEPYISPLSPLKKANGRASSPFPPEFPYDHHITFAENRAALERWREDQA